MRTSLDQFCLALKETKLNNAQRAIAVLWYHDFDEPDKAMTAGDLRRILSDHHLGAPNSTFLGEAIRKTRLTNPAGDRFRLKPGSRSLVREWLPSTIEGLQPHITPGSAYLPEELWANAPAYIVAVCKQVNGCVYSGYFDAAFVMLRRLFETLLIEAYEALQRSSEIKDNAGQGAYFMFGELVERCNGKRQLPGLSVGRNTKTALEDIKKFGDRSAHDRRFNACRSDLDRVQINLRNAAQDLMLLTRAARSHAAAVE